MNISVIILTCNQRDYTLRCLESIAGLCSRGDNETILVDNGSTDGTLEAVADRFPAVRRLRLDRNMGVAAGRNAGLRRARGRYLMLLDNDTVATAAAIEGLAEYLDKHPDVGLVAPRLTGADGAVQLSYKPFPGLGVKIKNMLGRRADTTDARLCLTTEPFYVIGAAQMFRREVYERVGELDGHIFFGPEDADYCMRVRAAGYRVVYDPDIAIEHYWQRATRRHPFTRASLRHLCALIYFYRKHRRWW